MKHGRLLAAISCLVLLGGGKVQGAPPMAQATATAAPAAVASEIPGEEAAKRLCSQCHTFEAATAIRHSRDGWNEVIGRMMNQGLEAPEDELYAVSDYLTANYGPLPRE